MSDMDAMEILAHYGVPGMKWGVRRSNKQLAAAEKSRKESKNSEGDGSSGQSGGSSRKEKKEAKKEAKRAAGSIKNDKDKTRYKESPKKLTDEELNSRIKRMETEKRYKELNKRTVSAGEKFATEVMVHAGKETGKKLATNALQLAIKKSIEKKMALNLPEPTGPRSGLAPFTGDVKPINTPGKTLSDTLIPPPKKK